MRVISGSANYNHLKCGWQVALNTNKVLQTLTHMITHSLLSKQKLSLFCAIS